MIAVDNLNNIIDKNYYPTVETARSNYRNRPIGIGVQGLADVYFKMRYPFESPKARQLNKQIFEVIYYAALSQSTKICRDMYQKYVAECDANGSVAIPTYTENSDDVQYVTYTDSKQIPKNIAAYPSMTWNGGAPISRGVLHWQLHPRGAENLTGIVSDYDTLVEHIKIYGVRNSQLIALMPTASTANLLGNVECFEPMNTNIYRRKVIAGEFTIINKYLINDLFKIGAWDKVKDYLIACNGSVQYIENLSASLKALYKTAWEINPEELIQQAIDRQPFVDQGQSLNWFVDTLTYKDFNRLMFKAWRGGLKTGKYYLRSKPAMNPQKFTLDPDLEQKIKTSVQQIATAEPLARPTSNESPMQPTSNEPPMPSISNGSPIQSEVAMNDPTDESNNTEQYHVECLLCGS